MQQCTPARAHAHAHAHEHAACHCCRAGDLEAIEDYMAVGKGDMKDGEGRSALHYAVRGRLC